MGLDIVSEDGTVTLWHASYGTFHQFRNLVAWYLAPDESLPELFEHSDWDGIWSPEECKRIHTALSKVTEEGNIWAELTGRLIRGLEYCIENKQRAIFC